MKHIRTITLSGIAMLLLAGTANAGQSTPQEIAATRQLNLEQAQLAEQQNAAAGVKVNAAGVKVNSTQIDAANLGTSSPATSAQSANTSSANASPAQSANASQAITNSTNALAPMALNSMSNPPNKIATARVVDDNGAPVGAVQKVEMDASGKPTRVNVALLGSQQIVALDSSNLSYDEPNNVLTAGLDKSQIVQMPAAPRS